MAQGRIGGGIKHINFSQRVGLVVERAWSGIHLTPDLKVSIHGSEFKAQLRGTI